MSEFRGWPAWSAQIDDLVGGYVVTSYPYPLSEHDLAKDGDKRKRGYVVAECMQEDDAAKIALLLNRACYVPRVDVAKWRLVSAGYLEGTLLETGEK